MRYTAYAVDLGGVARATYEIECANEREIRTRIGSLLEAHPAIEVWDGPRFVLRMTQRETSKD